MAIMPNTIPINRRYVDTDEHAQRSFLFIEDYDSTPLVSFEESIRPLAHIIPDIEQKALLAKEYSSVSDVHMSIDECASICLYSMEWQPYESGVYYNLNMLLRNRDHEHMKPWFHYLKILLTALHRIPSKRITVFRGVKLNLLEQYPKGKVFHWWSFSSCTTSVDVLQSEHFFGTEGTRTMFIIDCHTGKDVSRYSYFDSENEVLLLAGSRFQVVACLDQGNDLHTIQLEEIESTGSFLPSIKPSDPNEYKLRGKIAKFKSKSDIYLFGKHLTEKIVEILVQQAIIHKQCARLYLKEVNLTAQGAAIIADALYDNKTLKSLFLFHNHVADLGAQSLACALSFNGNSVLECLSLGWNSITDQGAHYIADMLKNNRTLTELWLPWNSIGNQGVQEIADTLRSTNKTLKTLSLRWNKAIDDASIDAWMSMLKSNQSLQVLDIGSCSLSRANKARLRTFVKAKKGFKLHL
jgi:hypothetical protein